MWKLPGTNLEHKLLETRNKRITEKKILEQVSAILQNVQEQDDQIISALQNEEEEFSNSLNPSLLYPENIYHLKDIEKICINYRLRFLDSKYFKAKIPYEALIKIKQLEKEHQTSLKGFKIIAPAKLFKLENADDPILMAPIGQDYFYLIHKWGNDLHPLRRILMWPLKTLENFALLLLVCSLLLALLVPDGMFSPQQSTTEFLMILFFIFKWNCGLAIFYGFKKGKNFSSAIWRSKFYNA